MLDKIAQSDSPDLLAELREIRVEVAELRALRPRIEALEQQLAGTSFACDEMSVSTAARLAGRCEQTVLNWIANAGVGRFDPQIHHYRVSRRKLHKYMVSRFGTAPAGLKEP